MRRRDGSQAGGRPERGRAERARMLGRTLKLTERGCTSMKPSCATRDACVSPCFHVAPTPPEPVAPPRPIPAAGAASGRVVLRRQNRPGQSRCYLERRLPSRRLHPGAREPQTTTDRARNCTGWFVARSDQIDRSIRCAERAFARAERTSSHGAHTAGLACTSTYEYTSMLESHLAN